MNREIAKYHLSQSAPDQALCALLYRLIEEGLPESTHQLWHGHPVWFLKGNPIVGYSKQKKGIRLMFWSGADFAPSMLEVRKGKFKDASIFYQSEADVDASAIQTWLAESRVIQWDYQNIVKRKGLLVRLEVEKG